MVYDYVKYAGSPRIVCPSEGWYELWLKMGSLTSNIEDDEIRAITRIVLTNTAAHMKNSRRGKEAHGLRSS